MVKKISNIIIKPIKLLLFLSILIMVLLVAAQVVFRYAKINVIWTEEIARIFFVWMMTFGIVVIEQQNAQTSTEILIEKLPPVVYIIWKGVICALECIFMLILFAGTIRSLPQVKMINLGTIRALDYRLLYYPMILCAPLTVWYLLCQWIDLVQRKGVPASAAGGEGENK